MTQRNCSFILACVLSLASAGCFKSKTSGLKNPDAPDSGTQNGDPEATAGRGGDKTAGRGGVKTAGRGGNASPRAGRDADPGVDGPTDPSDEVAGRCIQGGYCTEIDGRVRREADLLFVVDNSGSMRQEQAALREQFPKLITTLTSGITSSGKAYPALSDLHLGVVSTDMGLAGIANNFPGCNTQRHINGGDDGVLLHPGYTGPGCASAYPPWLSYSADSGVPTVLANDFSCISSLGTSGCGFEQQLEAGLKALWPKTYVDADGNLYPPEKNPILFLSTTAEGRFGHGDTPTEQGGNGGFLRKDALLAIVVVTDEEDCSSKNTGHFISTNDPSNPLSKQGINLRCYYNKQNLFEIDRYVKGFQGLKPGHAEDVIFAAIAGVPRELVSAEARADVTFSDPASRDEYYDRILNDMRMLERPMNENIPAIANVAPSCTRTDAFGERADAYPPRRIVEVAKAIGANATVQSICQDDFGPAIDGIIELTQSRAQVDCLPRQLSREGKNTIDCDLIWELPPEAGDCSGFAYLSNVSSPRAKTNERGGRNCKVAQLPITTIGIAPKGDGFFYDDFTPEREAECRDGATTRIAYGERVAVPPGVRAFLDCKQK